ncbi:MAG TPA: amidohydrolase family protein [Myxococcota bacterium]|nr:amidohydrolase family protein [Myxococcota bacterium]
MILRGGLLLHLDPPRVEEADIQIRDGEIVSVGRDLAGDEVRDLGGRWVMPGLVCGHTHLYSALACGMPVLPGVPRDFADMLTKVWWHLDQALDAESVEVSGLVGGLAALRAGVTTVVDHHASPSAIEGSLELLDGGLEQLGLRRVLCYEVTDRGGPERAAAGLRAHEGLLGEQSAFRAVMVGAHANFTLSDSTLARCGALAREGGVGLHIHLAEALDDERQVGEDLVARMQRLDALPEGSLLAHGVHLSPDQLRRLDDAGCWLAHQPRSNMNNAVGHAPIEHFPERTVLGTDGIGADMFAELQAGFFRANEAGSGWAPSRWLEALAAGGRFASSKLGVTLGRIEVGAQADLLLLDPAPGPPLSDDNLASSFVFRLSAAQVGEVLVAGRTVLRDGEAAGLGADVLDRRARGVAERLWGRMR